MCLKKAGLSAFLGHENFILVTKKIWKNHCTLLPNFCVNPVKGLCETVLILQPAERATSD